MNYGDEKILCPFYINENKASIKCEGINCFQEILVFESVSAKRRHMNKFCENKYSECHHYNRVNEKYKK